ncbi:MAG: zinc-dependent peptidase [Flavobacteriales bacterium]
MNYKVALLAGLMALSVFLRFYFRYRRRTLTRKQRRVMTTYASYYGHLDAPSKCSFERIVADFVNDKQWQGSGITVVDEMKVMIGSCAAQLLLGFPKVRLRHFKYIRVTAGPYRSERDGRMHLGEVRPGPGVIIISWSDFVKGYADPRNAYNVGLHEFAHALWFENTIENGEDHFLEGELLQKWNVQAHAEISRMNEGNGRFFREYAGSNPAEFFAVAVEYFFEQPVEFKKALPEIYGTLSALLRQDLAARMS